jgi:hypothetical protein
VIERLRNTEGRFALEVGHYRDLIISAQQTRPFDQVCGLRRFWRISCDFKRLRDSQTTTVHSLISSCGSSLGDKPAAEETDRLRPRLRSCTNPFCSFEIQLLFLSAQFQDVRSDG